MDEALDNLLSGLNEPQREAVTHTDGPLLILAGPGSGKTRVVTRRAAYLAHTVTRPRHILAITFTNKAAEEMRRRMAELGVTDGMTVGTFHAVCARWLRRFADRAGVSPDFTIYDRDDRRKLIARAIEECDLSTSNYSPAAVERDLSRAKNDMLSPAEYAARSADWRAAQLARIFERYEVLLTQMGALDFDDLLLRVAGMLSNDPALCEELEDRFRYVLIDEYQDTNAAQYSIARRVTQRRQNLCATGDPDQSIYGWRGADIRNILAFETDYPAARVVRLEQNYRSTGRILASADGLIAGNEKRKQKTLWTQNPEGSAVRVIECDEAGVEASWIVADIRRCRERGVPLREIAVFFRVNSLSRVLEEAFVQDGLAYQVARGVEFYNRKEIKDVLAYLRALANPADELSLLRIINTPPRGIGATTVQRMCDAARNTGRPLAVMLTEDHTLRELGRAGEKVRVFAVLLGRLAPVLDRPSAEALEFVINESGLRAHYQAEGDDEDSPIRNLEELVSAARGFQLDHPEASVRDWLEHTALLSDIDSVRDEAGAVTLMTLHAAKGLEFDIVYVIGLEEGRLPMQRREGEWSDIEEERRLLFVGMTRARKALTLCRARYRMIQGRAERTARSRFLDELPREQIEWVAAQASDREHGAGRSPGDLDGYAIGTLVRHKRLGLGRITTLQRTGRRTHVNVAFASGKIGSWVLEFAEFERVAPDEVGDVIRFDGD